MRGISRVLCAIDIDDAAGSAFAQALAVARSRNANLLLVCAVPPGEPFSRRAPDRVAYLLKSRREAEAAGVDVRADVQTGEAAEIVLMHAESRKADLIVIGVEHGRSQGRAWGSVAEDVLRSAPCPTLVVPAGARARSSFSKIVCAVASPADADAAVVGALQLFDPGDGAITLFHVVKDRAGEAAVLRQLQAVIPRDTGNSAIARVVAGAAAPEILKAGGSSHAELLVIGARARSRVGRRLFGVTRRLLTASASPVLAVPIDGAHADRVARRAA